MAPRFLRRFFPPSCCCCAAGTSPKEAEARPCISLGSSVAMKMSKRPRLKAWIACLPSALAGGGRLGGG